MQKKHQICQKCEFVFQIFIDTVLSRKKFCSKFTHFVGVLFTGLKSMVGCTKMDKYEVCMMMMTMIIWLAFWIWSLQAWLAINSLFNKIPHKYDNDEDNNGYNGTASFMNSIVLKTSMDLWNPIGTHFLWNRKLIIPDICHLFLERKNYLELENEKLWQTHFAT